MGERGRQRQLRIQEAACRLVIERGYDGFTMDNLAEEVGVSRRTLFNHVSSKEDAVLGPWVDSSDPRLVEFTRGGPTGELLPDLVALIEGISADKTCVTSDAPEWLHLLDQAVSGDARLRRLVERRFELVIQEGERSVCVRQGWPPDDLRSKVLARTLLSMVRLSLEESKLRPPGTPFTVIFREVLAAARAAGIPVTTA